MCSKTHYVIIHFAPPTYIVSYFDSLNFMFVHDISHSLFRTHIIFPSQLRAPLHRSLNIFAIALQTRIGFVIQVGLTRFVHGASCLHSLGFVFDRHAFGTTRFPSTSLWMWCWHRSWKNWNALWNVSRDFSRVSEIFLGTSGGPREFSSSSMIF